MTTYINLLDVLTAGRKLPKGMEWGIRSVHPDLRSSRGFRWPAEGWVGCTLPDSKLTRGSECPSVEGDGLCTGRTWAGMASGGIPAATLLLTQHYTVDVLGETPDKVRATRIMVVDVVDGLRLIREHGRGADLSGASLRCANLNGAQLHRVGLTKSDLRGVSLHGADLTEADLQYAHLYGAGLCNANLHGANMNWADLSRANLRGANLRGANLTGANLYDVCLVDVDLRGANLRGADLTGANLRGADLTGVDMDAANLTDAKMDGR